MKRSYQLPADSEAAKSLSRDIVKVLISSGQNYQDCIDALDLAGDLLLRRSKPVISDTLPQSASEQKL